MTVPRTLEHHVHPVLRGERPGNLHPVDLHRIGWCAAQATHLAGMWSDHEIGTVAAHELGRIIRKHGQPIGIQDDWYARARHEAPHDGSRTATRAQTRPDRDDVTGKVEDLA